MTIPYPSNRTPVLGLLRVVSQGISDFLDSRFSEEKFIDSAWLGYFCGEISIRLKYPYFCFYLMVGEECSYDFIYQFCYIKILSIAIQI